MHQRARRLLDLVRELEDDEELLEAASTLPWRVTSALARSAVRMGAVPREAEAVQEDGYSISGPGTEKLMKHDRDKQADAVAEATTMVLLLSARLEELLEAMRLDDLDTLLGQVHTMPVESWEKVISQHLDGEELEYLGDLIRFLDHVRKEERTGIFAESITRIMKITATRYHEVQGELLDDLFDRKKVTVNRHDTPDGHGTGTRTGWLEEGWDRSAGIIDGTTLYLLLDCSDAAARYSPQDAEMILELVRRLAEFNDDLLTLASVQVRKLSRRASGKGGAGGQDALEASINQLRELLVSTGNAEQLDKFEGYIKELGHTEDVE